MRNTLNSQFNKNVHESDVDSEAALRAQHAALAKMAAPVEPVTAPVAPTPVAPTAPLAPQGAVPKDPMQHPAFHGIINALRKPRVAPTLKIAPGLKGGK